LPKASDAKSFKSGLVIDEKNQRLYSLDINEGSISVVSLQGASDMARTESIGGRPYDIVMDPRGTLLYVSDWAGRHIKVIDPATLKVLKKFGVGEHPNQMVIHPKDGRLFVACASSNCVTVIDTKRGHVIETIYTSLFPRAPTGSTPCALGISLDDILY